MPFLSLLPSEAIPALKALGFILAPEAFLIASLLQDPSRFWVLIAIALVGAMVGGLLDYLTGRFGGRPVYHRFVKAPLREHVDTFFHRHGCRSLVVGSLLPVPFRPLVIACGVARLPFLLAGGGFVLGRFVRFLLLGGLVVLFQNQFATYFQGLTLLATALLMGSIGVFWFIRKRRQATMGPHS